MNLRTVICTLSLGFLLSMNGGCEKSSPPGIDKALAATNAVFRPNLQAPLTLSQAQVVTLKRVIAQFNEPSQVRREKEILPYESGGFELGDVHFGWLGRMLYVRDPETKRYYVVEDAVLAKMSKAFFEAQGDKPTLQYPSQEKWKEILTVLDGSH